VFEVHSFELSDVCSSNLVQETTDTSVQNAYLFGSGHGDILVLVKELSELFSSEEELLGSGIQIRTELGKRGNLTILGKIELH
jgi:hypothetical protein